LDVASTRNHSQPGTGLFSSGFKFPGNSSSASEEVSFFSPHKLNKDRGLHFDAEEKDNEKRYDSVQATPSATVNVSGNSNGGQLVINRSKEEKFSNPERLNLDRRKLTCCPVLEGEEKLRLLNYQNNLISKVENLDNLPNLIFLDLYNNHVRVIECLTAVTTLRVLMLGKNHLERIQGLDKLTRLDVLDLHSNNISTIENLDNLPELRVLNLAGNQIKVVNNLSSLASLTELNLRRNLITEVRSLEAISTLQRAFISNNQLASFDALESIFMNKNLLELALDGNPVASECGYRQVVLDNLKNLRHLDLKRVSDDERRMASAQARKAEERLQVEMKKGQAIEEKQEALKMVRDEWEEECKSSRSRELLERDSLSHGFMEVVGGNGNGKSSMLNVYGTSFDQLEKFSSGVSTAQLQYVTMRRAAPYLASLTGVTRLVLANNNLLSIAELNPVAAMVKLESLQVKENPVCSSAMLRPYVIYRIGQLVEFNGETISKSERSSSSEAFGAFSSLLSKHLSQSSSQTCLRLSSAMAQLGFEDLPGTPSFRTLAGSEQLRTTGGAMNRRVAEEASKSILSDACASAEAIETLHVVWPSMLRSLIETTVAEQEDPMWLTMMEGQ